MELFNQIQMVLGCILGVLVGIALIMIKGPTKKDGSSDKRFTSSKYQEKKSRGVKILGVLLLITIVLEVACWLIEKYFFS